MSIIAVMAMIIRETTVAVTVAYVKSVWEGDHDDISHNQHRRMLIFIDKQQLKNGSGSSIALVGNQVKGWPAKRADRLVP